MGTMYNDILLRKNLSDQGVVPATGTYTNSPDIIVSGTMPINNFAQYAKDNWNKDVGVDPVANAQNYIYARGKNLAAGAQSGNISLYYTKASIVMYPSKWLNNQLKTSDGQTLVPVQASNNGDIVATTNPFTWIPQMISDDHYCLVSMVGTQDHPMPHPTSDNMQDLANFLANNPNVAWRNVRIVDNGVDFATPSEYNQGTTGGTIYIFLECAACPDGSEVSFASSTPLADGTYVKHDWTAINGCDPSIKKHVIVGATFNIPANWNTTITYNYKSHNKAPLKGEDWNIELKAAFYQPPATNNAIHPLADISDHAQAKALEVHNQLLKSNTAYTAVGPGNFIGIGSHKTLGAK